MKLNTLVQSIDALQYISQVKLPTSISFKIGTLLRKANPYVEEFQKQQRTLFDKYGELIDAENPESGMAIKPENVEAYMKELEDLQDQEIDLQPRTIVYEALGEVKFVPARVFPLLGWVFTTDFDPGAATKIKRIDAYNAQGAFATLGQVEMPANTALGIMWNMMQLRDFINQASVQERDLIQDIPEAKDKNTALTDFRSVEVPLPLCQIPLSALEQYDVQASVFAALETFIDPEM